MKITLLFTLFLSPLFGTPTWKDKARVKALENIDLFLNWASSKRALHYPLAEQEVFDQPLSEIATFANTYSYFSLTDPIVGKVSVRPEDVRAVCALLKNLPTMALKGAALELACAEILTKCLAYRDLQLGQTVLIPVERQGEVGLELFTVSRIFDIWQGMPAFGLVPQAEHLSSILLFRGTDFSLITKRGIASVMSDLDPAGPGLSAFFRARPAIRDWLQSMQAQGKPARVMGFSLGGALAAYTFIYENGHLSSEPSLSVCAPGVAPFVIKAWERLPEKRKELLISYINAGDLVSQFGALCGTVYCLSTKEAMRPLTAHTTLMCAQTPLYKARVPKRELNYK